MALDAVSLTVEPGRVGRADRPERCRARRRSSTACSACCAPTAVTCTSTAPTSRASPVYKRARLGIGRTFQRIELFGGMTVRDHLLVAERSRLGTGRLWKDCLNLSQPTADERERCDHMLGLLGLDDVADRPIEALEPRPRPPRRARPGADDRAAPPAARRAVVRARPARDARPRAHDPGRPARARYGDPARRARRRDGAGVRVASLRPRLRHRHRRRTDVRGDGRRGGAQGVPR